MYHNLVSTVPEPSFSELIEQREETKSRHHNDIDLEYILPQQRLENTDFDPSLLTMTSNSPPQNGIDLTLPVTCNPNTDQINLPIEHPDYSSCQWENIAHRFQEQLQPPDAIYIADSTKSSGVMGKIYA